MLRKGHLEYLEYLVELGPPPPPPLASICFKIHLLFLSLVADFSFREF